MRIGSRIQLRLWGLAASGPATGAPRVLFQFDRLTDRKPPELILFTCTPRFFLGQDKLPDCKTSV